MPSTTSEHLAVRFYDVTSAAGTRLRAWTNDAEGPTLLLCNGLGTDPDAWPALLRPDCGVRVISWNHRSRRGTFASMGAPLLPRVAPGRGGVPHHSGRLVHAPRPRRCRAPRVSLRRVTLPAAFVAGGYDLLASSADMAMAAKRLPAARYVELPGGPSCSSSTRSRCTRSCSPCSEASNRRPRAPGALT